MDTPNLDVSLRRGLLPAATALGVLLVVGIAISRTELGGTALKDLIHQAQPLPLLAACLIMSLAFFFMALRWRALLPPSHQPPALGLTAMLCAGLLLNYAMPGPVGELGAAWFAHRRYNLSLAQALASGIGARLVGLIISAIGAWLIWLGTDLPVPPEYERIVTAAALVIGVAGLGLAVLASLPRQWRSLSARIARAFPGRLTTAIDQGVDQTCDALEEVRGLPASAYARAVFWAAAGHASVIAGAFLALSALGTQAAIGGLAFSYAMSTAGAVALFALPGSQVGWDAMFFTLLVATADLIPAHALALTATIRVQQLALLLVGAAALSWLAATSPPPQDEGGNDLPPEIR